MSGYFTRADAARAARDVADRAESAAEEPDVNDVPFDRDMLIVLATAFNWFAHELEGQS